MRKRVLEMRDASGEDSQGKEHSLELMADRLTKPRARVEDVQEVHAIGNSYLKQSIKSKNYSLLYSDLKKRAKSKYKSLTEKKMTSPSVDFNELTAKLEAKDKKSKNEKSVFSHRTAGKTSVATRYSIPVRIKKRPVDWKRQLEAQKKSKNADILASYIKKVNTLDRKAHNYDNLAQKSTPSFTLC